ncbi:MAG: hypothetical protein K2H43_01215, partial [Clostridia bacterium]|nr:hypothetical protein [Clostridia bacterium]
MEELFASPDQAIQIVVRPANGSDARDVHRVYFKKLSSETDFGLKIKEIEEFNRNFEEYRNSANGDLAPTFLEYTVVFNQSTITFEVDFGGTDAFIRGTYQILRKRDWNPVAVQNGNLAANDAIGNLNNDELVGFTNETESVVPLVYGLNVLFVNPRSSDETAIQPVVIIIDRELPDFKAIGVLEIEQFTQDYKYNAEYRSKEEKYVYTVANGVSKLNVTIENFEELESEVIGADSLVVGKNTVTIYLYEKTAENGNVAAREGREPVKTVILEINREAAQDNSKMMWMILFFVMLGLALLLLLILLFIPKRKKNATQQVILAATPYIQP